LKVFSYADMPFDMAEASFKLFSKEVLPRLKELPDLDAVKNIA